MSTSREILAELIGRGMTRKDIAGQLGRHNSLVYQIEQGKKPGHNLRDALDAIRSGAPVPEPARREQRIRQPVRRGGERWSSATVKTRRAVENGARGLRPTIRDAAASGRRLAFIIHDASGKEIKIGNAGRGIDAEAFAAYLDAFDGDVWAALEAWCDANGESYFDGASPGRGIAVSSWSP